MHRLDLTLPTPEENLALEEALLESSEGGGGPELLRFWESPDHFVLLGWRENRDRMSRTDPRYSVERFRACKREYLRRGVLGGGRPFYQWGAGNAGKDWLREWDEPRPVAVVDINPRKIGKTIHSVQVIRPDDLPTPGSAVVLVAVVLAHARVEIRQWLDRLGYVEGRDWFFIC